MNKKIGIIFLVMIIVITYSCKDSDSFITHEKGFDYRIINDNDEGALIQNDDILELNVKYYSENDSLIFDSKTVEGIFRIKVSDSETGGIFQDAIKILSVGDSAQFLIPANDFFTKTTGGGIPPMIKENENVRFDIKVEKIAIQEELNKEYQDHLTKMEAEEKQILSEYISIEDITIEPTESGLYIIKLEWGKGEKAVEGKKAMIHYKGTLLNGQQFDSSIDRDEPIEFVIGNKEVIPAWDEAVASMRVGDKIKIIVPSNIAYSSNGAGGVIPPFATLIFEIKLLGLE